MFNKIVVLLDGSPLAQCVLPHTRALAQTFQAQVAFLHVLEPEDKSDTGRIDPVHWHLRKAEAQSYLQSIVRQWGQEGPPPQPVLLEGQAADRIIEYIEGANPDLIVLSSHGQSGLTAWNVSSVAQKTIYRAFRSFMLVRAYQEVPIKTGAVAYRRIVVPLDGSKRAEYVLPFAARLAESHQAELLLVHAHNQPEIVHRQPLAQNEADLLEQLDERNRVQAERYLTQAARATPHAVSRFLSGANTADALLDFVQKNEIDLVVMSAHGYSGETIRPYGSIVTSFIAYGSTSLLIIQDLPQDKIKPTQAELSAAARSDTGPLPRTTAYAQLATRSPG